MGPTAHGKYLIFIYIAGCMTITCGQLLNILCFCRNCCCCSSSATRVGLTILWLKPRQIGTMAVVTTWCQNPKCPKKENVWHSQPYMPGTKTPAGNFLLCFAILLAGGSASKIFQIFQHMGLACISLSTFFHHQRVCVHDICKL